MMEFGILFSSTMTDAEGFGYIHAYSTDGSGEIEGFPLRPEGFTFLNGAVLGDIDNDGMMDLTANSNTLTFGGGVDMSYVNTYNLNIPFDKSKILSNGYKGSNTRDGLIKEEVLSVNEFFGNEKLNIFPNPTKTHFKVKLDTDDELLNLSLYNNLGQLVLSTAESFVDVTTLASGLYVVQVMTNKGKRTSKVIIE